LPPSVLSLPLVLLWSVEWRLSSAYDRANVAEGSVPSEVETSAPAASPATDEDDAGSEFLDVSGDGGVLKRTLRAGGGVGLPVVGQGAAVQARVRYAGRLESGDVFDNRSLATFTVGEGHLVKGWDMVVATMREGEEAEITIRADYAYGVAGLPPRIPPHATLTFVVELLDFELIEREAGEQTEAQPPALPSTADGSETKGESQGRTIMVGSTPIKVDALGPVIVNEDGTLRRIANWNDLTEAERQVAVRRIAARNQARLAHLRDEKHAEL